MTTSLAQRQRMKKCCICGNEFVPRGTTARVCGFDCAVAYAQLQNSKRQRDAKKQERKARRAAREKIKSRSDRMREAQAAFNGYIRERDKEEPCISCGRHHDGQWHAGHYRPTSTAPALRFHEDNVHKQCQPCNTHMHGNLVEYRIRLIIKIGAARLEWLEGPHEPAKWTSAELIEIKSMYKAKLKALREGVTG